MWAVPAIVTGQYPVQQNAVPTRRYYPNNLFTMLRESYRMITFGRFLQLCPTDSCGYDLEVRDSLSALVADLGIVYLIHRRPPGLRLPFHSSFSGRSNSARRRGSLRISPNAWRTNIPAPPAASGKGWTKR